MSAPENLNDIQFQRPEQVSREEHTNAVLAAQQRDPEKYWSVSPPEPRTQSFAVRDQHGNTHGYYALANARREGRVTTRYLGALVNTSGAKGVGSFVLDRLQKKRNVNLDAFSGPLEGYYSERGFSTTSRMKFDDKYAPPSWKPEYGRSDVIDMKYRRAR
jgi:hypothetical protein